MKAQVLARFIMLIAAIALMVHGWIGPQFAPKNLTALFIWVHFRGLAVLALLLFGNLFCGICPFVLTRNFARRFWSPRWNWPTFLRRKWLAAGVFAAFLMGYEYFGWWSSPRATAILILSYFLLILAIDLTFKRASFCQFVCPIGQFNFLGSLLSPATVRVKSLGVCQTCESKACLKGAPGKRGCELGLYVPRKPGNWNCTFCMDCKAACPHDNIRLGAADGWSPLLNSPLWQRTDIGALICIFTFGAVFNAFAMVEPARAFNFFGLAALALIGLPGLILRVWPRRPLAALVPLGFAVWFSHYSFHFLTGAGTFLPVIYQPEPLNWAGSTLGLPVWVVQPLQFGSLALGTAASLAVVHLRARSLALAIPWHILILALAGISAWVFSLPMDMRGTFVGG